MRFSFFQLFSIFTFILAGVSGYYAWTFNVIPQTLVTPIVQSDKLKMADNFWTPKEVKAEDDELAGLTAQAAFFVETGSGEVLFEKNAHQRMRIASLTKIMTMVVGLEQMSPDKMILISDEAAAMEPDKMYLLAGESLRFREILEGMLLVSANDGAEAVAENTTGRRAEFIQLMNSKARNIGMRNTLFINPTGLEEDGRDHYSTAYDVSLMSHYAARTFPLLTEISKEPQIYIPATETHQEYDLYNGVNLLTSYPGVIGFKTGYTPEAGLTLVTIARREGKEVIGVLLGCTNRRDDAKRLLDYSFKKLGVSVQ